MAANPGDGMTQYGDYAAAFASQAGGEARQVLGASQSDGMFSQSNASGRSRTRLPPETVKAFEAVFARTRNPPAPTIQELANQFGLEATKVKTWFNNRKAKEKRQQSANAIDVTALAAQGMMYGEATGPESNHMLTTQSGYQFSIDESPGAVTLEMFAAMRDRIIQLETHISSMPQPTMQVKRSASAMSASTPFHGTPSIEHSPKAESPEAMEGPPAKRLNVALSTIQNHIDGILAKLKQEVAKKHFESPEDVCECVLHETMTVDEFVAVFDEKGGSVRAVPKDPSDPASEHLVSVEFSTMDTVANLMGFEGISDLESTMQQADETSQTIQCHIQSLNVLYDKTSGRVSMAFHVLPAPATA
ncbi:LIM/homeobox protein Lhx6 [Sorochytrium milnesiophthora]